MRHLQRARPSISVVVPTNHRPDHLRNCLAGLARQTDPAETILVVAKSDDVEAEAICQSSDAAHVSLLRCDGPGYLAPLREAIGVLWTDVVAFIDDDAVARPDWLAKLRAGYTHYDVAGVGGRIVNHYPGVLGDSRVVHRVGRLSPWGKLDGNLHQIPATNQPLWVDHFAGSNMSFYRKDLDDLPDMMLNRFVARRYEVDLGNQVCRRTDKRLLYLPDAIVDHYPGVSPLRDESIKENQHLVDQAENVAFNWTLILKRHTPWYGKPIALTRWFVWGDSESPGLLRGLLMHLLKKPRALDRLRVSMSARVSALLS